MNNLFLALIIAISLLPSSAYPQVMPEFPYGWKPATESDYSTEDLSFRKNRGPNHIEADFNGDGILDHAWILINTSKKAFGLFIFLGQKNSIYKRLLLDEHKRETDKLFMGISLMEPGQYKTACGKGYWACKDKEPEVLKIKSPGINYFAFESASSVFFWDAIKKEFTRIWMSD